MNTTLMLEHLAKRHCYTKALRQYGMLLRDRNPHTGPESEGSINHPDEESKQRKQKPCTRFNQCSLPASAYYSAGGYKVVLNPDPIKDPPNNFSGVYNA